MKGANEISNTDNVLDSRDIIERIEYLESEREALTDEVDKAQEALDDLDADQFEEVSAFEEAEQTAGVYLEQFQQLFVAENFVSDNVDMSDLGHFTLFNGDPYRPFGPFEQCFGPKHPLNLIHPTAKG